MVGRKRLGLIVFNGDVVVRICGCFLKGLSNYVEKIIVRILNCFIMSCWFCRMFDVNGVL